MARAVDSHAASTGRTDRGMDRVLQGGKDGPMDESSGGVKDGWKEGWLEEGVLGMAERMGWWITIGP